MRPQPGRGSCPLAVLLALSLALRSESQVEKAHDGGAASGHGGGSPSTANALGSVGVEQSVGQRVEEDSKSIGMVAQRLVDIQEGIRQVEQEVLGKVFDMSSMKAFLNRHGAALEESKRLGQESSRLLGQVNALAGQLTIAKQQFEEQDILHRKMEEQLEAQVHKEEAEAARLLQSIRQEKVLVQTNKELRAHNEGLRGQNAEALGAVETVMAALAAAKAQLVARQQETKHLEAAEEEQRHYAEDCEMGVTELEGRMDKVEEAREESRDRDAKLETSSAQVFQRIVVQNNLLKARLLKARANEATVQSQVVMTTEQVAALQLHGQAELRQLHEHLEVLRGRALAAETNLTSEVQERKVIESEIGTMTEQLQLLEAELLKGELQALETNNTILKKELEAAQIALQDSQGNMARSHAEASNASMILIHLRTRAEQNAEIAQKVAQQSLAQVVAVRRTPPCWRSQCNCLIAPTCGMTGTRRCSRRSRHASRSLLTSRPPMRRWPP